MSLRDLLLEIKVKVDQSAVKQTDQAFDHATQSAQAFENKVNAVSSKLQNVQKNLRASIAPAVALGNSLTSSLGANVLSNVALPPGALPPKPPSERKSSSVDDSFLGPKGPRPPSPGDLLPPVIDTKRAGIAGVWDELRIKIRNARNEIKETVPATESLVSKLGTVRNAFIGLGASMAVRQVAAFLNETIEAGGALADMSARTRLSVETLQVWSKEATLAGASNGQLEGGFRRLARSMAGAQRGGKLQVAAFEELGVTYKNTDGSLRNSEDVMIDVGSALVGLDDDAKASALSTQLLGGAGTALIPIFADGAEAVRARIAAGKEFVSISGEEAKRLDEVGDKIAISGAAWKGFKNRLVIALLPVLEKLVGWFTDVSKKLFEVAKNSKVLQTILLALAAGGIGKLVTVIGAWITKVGGARAAMALLGNSLRTAAGAALRFIAPLLIIEDFLVFLAGGKSVFGKVFETMFGAGGAEKARTWIKATIGEFQASLDKVIPLVQQFMASPIFGDVKSAGLSTLLLTLQLIGIALADDKKKSDDLWDSFNKQAAPVVDLIDAIIAKIQALGEAIASPFEKLSGMLGMGGEGGKSDEFTSKLAPGLGANKGGTTPTAEGAPATTGARAWLYKATGGLLGEAGVTTSPVPSAPTVPGGQAGKASVVTLNDQRTTTINVESSSNPGAVGRAVAGESKNILAKDRRQTLAAVSG